MAKPTLDNLIPNSERTPEELRAMTVAGGKASGEARRRKKRLREWMEQALVTEMRDKHGGVILSPDTGEPLTREEAATLKVLQKAVSGDLQAYEMVAKILGEWVDKRESTMHIGVEAIVRSQEDACRYIYADYSQTYQRFFYDTRNYRDVLLQGGRRSGKTQATIRHLVRLADAMNADVNILVCTSAYKQLTATMRDFTQATGVPIEAHKATTKGATWDFMAFDEATKAQGHQCDYLFINEAVNMPRDVADTLLLGVRRQVFYNFNPTQASWVTERVVEDGANLLRTTFRDNDYLPPSQVAEFELLAERAKRPNATTYDRYMYEVYYLGEFSSRRGPIFANLATCTRDEYCNVPATEYYGLDFGFATEGDPTVLMGVKIANNRVYVRQYIYEQGVTDDARLVRMMEQHGLTYATDIYADYGGMGKGRIRNLRDMGWSVVNAHKTEILDGISQILCFDGVTICEGGDEALSEFENYAIGKTGKPEGIDHAIDATRYAFISAKNNLYR